MFKSLHKLGYLGEEDLLYELLIEKCLINADFLENKTEDRIAGAYASITEIINNCQEVGSRSFLILNNHFLSLLRGNQ